MKKYNPKSLKKSGKTIGRKNGYINPGQIRLKKILCARNVSLSFWKNSHGTFRNYTIGDVTADSTNLMVIMFCILWDGIVLGCLQKMLP